MRSDVGPTLRSPQPELQMRGHGKDAVKAVNTSTRPPAEPTGTVVCSTPTPSTSTDRVDRARKATISPLSSVWRYGLSDGCRAPFRLRSVTTPLITRTSTLARAFRVKLGKYCNGSTGGSHTQ